MTRYRRRSSSGAVPPAAGRSDGRRRLGLAGGLAGAVALFPGPAIAATAAGSPAGTLAAGSAGRLGPLQVVLIFVVIPVALAAVIALLAAAGDLARRPRYRPGRSWDHEPLWFAGPPDPDAALRSVTDHDITADGGGASGQW